MEPKMIVDIWVRLFEEKKRAYIAAGMSADDADEKACTDIRREIRQATTLVEVGRHAPV